MSTIAEKLAREHGAIASRLPSGVVSTGRRAAAVEELLARGLPTGRDENWRYANLRVLERASFAPAEESPAAADAGQSGWPEPLPGFARWVLLDGVLRADLSAAPAASAGVTVRSARATIPDAAPAGGSAPHDSTADGRFALVNEAFALDSVSVATGPGAAGVAAIELLVLASGRGATYPRVRIEVAPGTALRLLERHVGGASGTLSSVVTTVAVGRDASLEHVRIQDVAAEATWIDTLEATVGRGAAYRLGQYSVGARSARSTLRIALAEPEAAIALYGVSLAAHAQTSDVYARIEHAAPRTRTTEVFRGIGAGRARVAFNGHVVVRAGAAGADSKQSIRGLLAGADAEVDARPQLEIYTDDVKCSHGATAGKLDEAMMFYLLSRGLERDTAQSLLKWAFLEDAVAPLGDPALRTAVEELLAAHLGDETVSAGRRP